LLLCVQSEMLQESNILKFKFQVQSSQHEELRNIQDGKSRPPQWLSARLLAMFKGVCKS